MTEEIRLDKKEPSEHGGVDSSINDIKAKIKAAERAKEKDIEGKISEIEALMLEGKRIDELVQEAQSNVEYWDSMQKLGELKRQDAEKFKEMENILISLEERLQEIKRKIEIVYRHPAINEKLQEEAFEEDETRNKKNIFEKNKQELEESIKTLAEDIKELAPRRGEAVSSFQKQERTYFSLKNKIEEFIEKAKNLYLEKGGGKEDFLKTLEYRYTDENYMAYLVRLQKLREGLGIFKGKEKATIDYLINHRPDFENMQQAYEGMLKNEKERNQIKGELAKLHLRYREINKKFEELQEAMGKDNISWRLNLNHPSSELNSIMSNYADLKHYRETQEIGTYKGWYDATSKSESAHYLYDTYKDVIGREV